MIHFYCVELHHFLYTSRSLWIKLVVTSTKSRILLIDWFQFFSTYCSFSMGLKSITPSILSILQEITCLLFRVQIYSSQYSLSTFRSSLTRPSVSSP